MSRFLPHPPIQSTPALLLFRSSTVAAAASKAHTQKSADRYSVMIFPWLLVLWALLALGSGVVFGVRVCVIFALLLTLNVYALRLRHAVSVWPQKHYLYIRIKHSGARAVPCCFMHAVCNNVCCFAWRCCTMHTQHTATHSIGRLVSSSSSLLLLSSSLRSVSWGALRKWHNCVHVCFVHDVVSASPQNLI